MRKIYLTLLTLVLATVTVTAQENVTDTYGKDDPHPSFKGFVTNRFWDNWELSLGAGTGLSVYSGLNYGSWGDRFGWNGELSATKWFMPVVGVRAGLMGGMNNTVRNTDKIAWPFLYGHVDALLNMSNWISGYKEDRIYQAVLFAGMGLYCTNFTEASRTATGNNGTAENFAFTAGLLNKFRVSPSIDINLELRGILGMSSLNPVAYSGRGTFLGNADVLVGVTYRFGKRDFERGTAGYAPADIAAMKDEITKATNEAAQTKEDLGQQLAQANNDLKATEVRAKEAEDRLVQATAKVQELENQLALDLATPEQMIFFDFGMAVLTTEDQIRLNVLADQIKAGPEDYVYTITGYADFNTGEEARNAALAEKRARVVYNRLVELGISAERLTYQGTNADNQPFNANGNQVVIIK